MRWNLGPELWLWPQEGQGTTQDDLAHKLLGVGKNPAPRLQSEVTVPLVCGWRTPVSDRPAKASEARTVAPPPSEEHAGQPVGPSSIVAGVFEQETAAAEAQMTWLAGPTKVRLKNARAYKAWKN